MGERIRVTPEEIGDIKSLTDAERASIEVLNEYIEMTGCESCLIAPACNAHPGFSLIEGGRVEHMIIETSELKRDIQKNNSQRLKNGEDLTVERDKVELWAMVTAESHPELGFLLEEVDALWACINCPKRLEYQTEVLVEYEPGA